MKRRTDFRDLTGATCGRWTVVAYSHSKDRITYWHCVCSCGKTAVVNGMSLRSGRSQSCGCLHRERQATRLHKHGHAKPGNWHPLYTIWAQMKSRCYSTTARGYANYGGRGVTVCDRWRESFEAFLADMGDRPSPEHTLDRYPNNDGNYEPGNCRWATPAQQQRNKRNNRLLTCGGKTLCVQEWAELLGVRPNNIMTRLRLGWTAEEALAIPYRKYRPRK